MTCPLCDGSSARTFEVRGFWLRDCERCGHRFAELEPIADGGSRAAAHVARHYGDDYFRGGGAGYPDYLAEGPILLEHARRYAAIVGRHVAAPGSVLDVGAAAGFLLRAFVDAGWRGRGIEPNRSMAAYARDRLGLDVDVGTLEALGSRGGEPVDLLCMVQVVAHLCRPREALAAAARLTRPGGLWLIETWDRGSLAARLLGKRWHEYSPPTVLHWFTRDGLRSLAEHFGMREVASGRPRKRISAAHARSLLVHSFAGTRAGTMVARLAAAVPDQLAIPHPFDDVFWTLLRRERGA